MMTKQRARIPAYEKSLAHGMRSVMPDCLFSMRSGRLSILFTPESFPVPEGLKKLAVPRKVFWGTRLSPNDLRPARREPP